MKMTVDDFIAKALSFCKTKLAPKLTEESNKVTLGVKLYFAPKKIKLALSSPEARDTIMTPDGYVDVGEVEGAIMNGFEYGSKYPFLGICDLNKADVEEFFTFLKG
jgi:hypothetical protein